LFGVFVDVATEVIQLRLAANDVIKGFSQPQGALTLDLQIDVTGTAAFPVTQYFAKNGGLHGLNQGMEMIGHHTPGIKPIGLWMTGKKAFDQQVSTGLSGENAFAMPCIQ
jgi:hypothetical protein